MKEERVIRTEGGGNFPGGPWGGVGVLSFHFLTTSFPFWSFQPYLTEVKM